MKTARISRQSDQRVYADVCEIAVTPMQRFMGLMGRDRLDPGTGLLLEPCNSIHTFFMRFPIDVIYLDQERKVLKVCAETKPWRMHFPVFGARSVLELPTGAAEGLKIGDYLCLS